MLTSCREISGKEPTTKRIDSLIDFPFGRRAKPSIILDSNYNDKSTAFDTNMNRARFHNALALSLGYVRIVKDKRIAIEVDEADDPWVTLRFQDHPDVLRFMASSDANEVELKTIPAMQEEIKSIVDAVHQAYNYTIASKF